MLKQLFNPENAAWTKEGEELVNDVNAMMRAVMREWVERGYSPREIGHIMAAAVYDVEIAAATKMRRTMPPPLPHLKVVNE